MIRVALPKGRLGNDVYDRFAAIGYSCPELKGNSRKLVFEDAEKGISYILVKPSDVAVYVERGAADIGVIGRDTLLEYSPDVYELCDLGLGRCSIAVAAKNGWKDNTALPLRVATKYPNVAKRYYAAQSREIDIISLHGSIELAPIVGLSDVIVDIVETGTTLKENDLSVVTRIEESSARLIANKSSYMFKKESIDAIVAGMEAFSE
ncbi:MAG: ATP phosphoribosyltransferase [Oscillospiraceae bacterium]|nr:ATP phosphoribosyltransferase [Oscillospiraceae bacterium]